MAVRIFQLGYRSGTDCDNGVTFFHHKNVIQAFPAFFCPADIFKVAETLALTVHVVRDLAVTGKLFRCECQHLIGGFTVSPRHILGDERRRPFQCKRMNRNIFRRKR